MEMKPDSTLIPSANTLLKISKKYDIPFSTLRDDVTGLQTNMLITRISNGVYMVNPSIFIRGQQSGIDDKKTDWNKYVALNAYKDNAKERKEKRKVQSEQRKAVNTAKDILKNASDE